MRDETLTQQQSPGGVPGLFAFPDHLTLPPPGYRPIHIRVLTKFPLPAVDGTAIPPVVLTAARVSPAF